MFCIGHVPYVQASSEFDSNSHGVCMEDNNNMQLQRNENDKTDMQITRMI